MGNICIFLSEYSQNHHYNQEWWKLSRIFKYCTRSGISEKMFSLWRKSSMYSVTGSWKSFSAHLVQLCKLWMVPSSSGLDNFNTKPSFVLVHLARKWITLQTMQLKIVCLSLYVVNVLHEVMILLLKSIFCW